jgi:hypothetical protein
MLQARKDTRIKIDNIRVWGENGGVWAVAWAAVIDNF